MSSDIGHNRPPTDQRIQIIDALGEKYRTLLAKFAEREAGVKRRLAKPIMTQAEADLATDFVGQCMGVIDESKEAHTTEKKPWLIGGKAIDEFFLRRNEAFTLAFSGVTKQIKAWDDTQKAKQRTVEAVARGQGITIPPLAPVRTQGPHGTVAIPQTKWTFDIEDPTLIPLGYLMPDEKTIQRAIDESDGKIEIPGIKVKQVDTMQIRRKR